MDPHPSRTTDLRLRAAVESSPSGILMADAEGQIVLVNREIERLFGYVREELLGKPVELLVPERFHGGHPRDRREFTARPKVRAMGGGRELFGRRKDGSEVPLEVGLTPVITDEGMFVLASVVDISARVAAERSRRELEEQLRQSQKLEALGTLASGIAHDFRNILNGIIGYAELMAKPLVGRQEGADLMQLLSYAERGRQLVDRILTFSRQSDQVRQPVRLTQQVEEVLGLLRPSISSAVDIRVELDPDAPPVLADPTAVHQVLMNLCTNAAQAMPSGGQLTISVEPLYVRDSLARANPDLREGPYALLTVRDTGFGIDPAVIGRVFDPFFTTKPVGTGTGLGLAMVHGILNSHQGAVRLSSVVNEGTEVRCFFPAVEAVLAEPVPPEAPVLPGKGERILFVDDEEPLARLGQRRLQGLGYRVTIATTCGQALAVFRADPHAFDLVITDYTMPDRSGLELATELVRLRPDIPVLLTTGHVDEFPERDLQAAGIQQVLMKPVVLDDLATGVVRALKPKG
ncbi:MAG: PAS domain S-box protein [Gemmatimonadetes bacterium]|nr:PAS domain S-box protein [Gemmatimonadota bacterium]